MLKAAFWLLAIVILCEVGATIIAGLSCVYMIVSLAAPMGACQPLITQIREIWAEVLAAILALLLAARTTNGGANGDNHKPPDQ